MEFAVVLGGGYRNIVHEKPCPQSSPCGVRSQIANPTGQPMHGGSSTLRVAPGDGLEVLFGRFLSYPSLRHRVAIKRSDFYGGVVDSQSRRWGCPGA